MKTMTRNIAAMSARAGSVAALSALVAVGTSVTAHADEADAKRMLKEMSDYIAAQQAISFDYDASLEVVTEEGQKLALASSGSVVLNKPDKMLTTRHGGFANVQMSYDGKTLTLLGKDQNRYAQKEIAGDIDNLVDVLRNDYNRPLPAADLITSHAYDSLMDGVIDVKDLGSGVINGVECNYMAFRKEAVDFQIWIAQGADPYPCRYVITSKEIAGSPEYSLEPRDWKTGDAVAATEFSFTNPSNADQIDLSGLEDASGLPANFSMEAAK